MPEVKRYQFKGAAGEYVYANDFDRVTAERDALQALLSQRDEQIDALTASGLSIRDEWRKDQQRMIAADDRADVLEVLLRDAQKAFDYDPAGSCYNPGIAFVKPWSERVISALKPAERTNTSGKAHCPHDGICHTSDETCAEARERIDSLRTVGGGGDEQ